MYKKIVFSLFFICRLISFSPIFVGAQASQLILYRNPQDEERERSAAREIRQIENGKKKIDDLEIKDIEISDIKIESGKEEVEFLKTRKSVYSELEEWQQKIGDIGAESIQEEKFLFFNRFNDLVWMNLASSDLKDIQYEEIVRNRKRSAFDVWFVHLDKRIRNSKTIEELALSYKLEELNNSVKNNSFFNFFNGFKQKGPLLAYLHLFRLRLAFLKEKVVAGKLVLENDFRNVSKLIMLDSLVKLRLAENYITRENDRHYGAYSAEDIIFYINQVLESQSFFVDNGGTLIMKDLDGVRLEGVGERVVVAEDIKALLHRIARINV